MTNPILPLLLAVTLAGTPANEPNVSKNEIPTVPQAVTQYQVTQLLQPSKTENYTINASNHDMIYFTTNAYKYGFIDAVTGFFVPPTYDGYTSFYADDVAVAQKGAYQGVINKSNQIVVPFEYDSISSFDDDGIATVKKIIDGKEKWGKIDKNGTLIRPLIYDTASDATILPSDIFGETYEYVYPFTEGIARVRKDGKWGYIHEDRTIIADCIYDDPTLPFQHGYAIVRLNGKYGIINQTGETIIPTIYDTIGDDLAFFAEHGIMRVKKDGKWGIVDKNGNLLVPCEYIWIDNFSDGYAFFAEDDVVFEPYYYMNDTTILPNVSSYGVMDISGNIVARNIPLDPMWKFAQQGIPGGSFSGGREVSRPTQFHEGLAAAHDADGRWGYINTNGEIVIPPQFDTVYMDDTYSPVRVGYMSGAGDFWNGYAKVQIDGKYNLIDKQGNFMLAENWDAIEHGWDRNGCTAEITMDSIYTLCQNNTGTLQVVANGKHPVLFGEHGTLYDADWQEVLTYDADSMKQIGNGIFTYEQNGLAGLIKIEPVPQV